MCKRVIFLMSGFVLPRPFLEKRKEKKSWAIQGKGQNTQPVSKWRQCDIKTLVTVLVDVNDIQFSLGKWKTKAGAFLYKLDMCYAWDTLPACAACGGAS